MARHEIGSYIYLFTRGGTNEFADEVVISAHGSYKNGDPPFIVEGPALKFYSAEGAPANASGLTLYPHMVKETTDPGKPCRNYYLQKFQGYHGTESGKPAETYESIQTDIGGSVARIRDHNEMLATASTEALEKAGLTNDPVSLFDVATIRNRWCRDELRLKYVIEQLLKKHPYKVVHCSFCRVRQ